MQQLDLTLPIEVNTDRYRDAEVLEIAGEIVRVRYRDTYGDSYTKEFNTLTGVCIGQEMRDEQFRIRNRSNEIAQQFYQVWFGREADGEGPAWTKDQWRYIGNDEQHQFTTGKAASDKVAEYNALSKSEGSPWRFMVKPYTHMSPDHKWRTWMLRRFETGEYSKVPWSDEEWVIKDHFVHASLADPFQVAFVENEKTGVMDRMKVMRPGAYLKQYYGSKLSEREIAQWATKMDNEAELCFAVDPDEIEKIYATSRIASCMAYKADHFCTGIHPTRVYGAGDLALAYLKRGNKIIARALVWPEKKKIQRVYGDQDRLLPRLVAEGYDYPSNNGADFYGARILRIQVSSEMVMPYMDWNLHAKDNPKDKNTLLLCGADGAKYHGQSQNGIASGRSISTCGNRPHCTNTFATDSNGAMFYHETGRNYCPTCSSEHLRTCRHCGHNIRLDNTTNPIRPTCNREGQPSNYYICRNCVSSSYPSYIEYEGRVYNHTNTSLRDGVRIPLHILEQQPEEALS